MSKKITNQLKWTAQTGRQQPNMSTTFMGRSKPLDDLWRQTPRSAAPGGQREPEVEPQQQ